METRVFEHNFFQQKMIWNTTEWLSLNNFPDDTKLFLTERGRQFIFQSSSPPAKFHAIIDKTKWLRYKSTKESIPLSIIKAILNNNEKELFISSFMVTGLGSQKLSLSTRLPINISNSEFPRLLALMCLSRGIFVSGAYQSDMEDKTEAFLDAFEGLFGSKPTVSQNKRGYYTKITEQLVKGIVNFVTGKDDATVPEIIESVSKLREDDILEFILTWLRYSRVYRNEDVNNQFLFEFRVNEETDSIVKLLTSCKIEWGTGSLRENSRIVPIYGIKNTIENLAILNLKTYEGKDNLRRELLEEISQLRTNIEQKNARLDMMGKIIEELNDELDLAKEKAKKVSYSKYYYEKRSHELKQKCEELSRLKNEIQVENVHLKRVVKESIFPRHDVQIPIIEKKDDPNYDLTNQYEEEDILETYNSVLDELNSLEEEKLLESSGKRTRMRLTFEKEILEDRQSNLSSKMLTKDLLRQLLLLLSIPENWIFVVLSKKGKTLSELRQILDHENTAELRRSIANYENLGLLTKEISTDEAVYSLNVQEILRQVEDKRARITRNENPADIRHYVKTIIPR